MIPGWKMEHFGGTNDNFKKSRPLKPMKPGAFLNYLQETVILWCWEQGNIQDLLHRRCFERLHEIWQETFFKELKMFK